MLKEIFTQALAVAETLEGRVAHGVLAPDLFGPHAEALLRQTREVNIVACGTSYHAGLVAKYWLEGLAGIPCTVEVASEFRYRHPVVRDNTLFVTISQSGETADTLRALEEYLDDWPGIVVVVSHDRVFLDRTVNEVLALDGNGNAEIVRGGVAGWLATRANKPKSQNAPQLRSTTTAPSAKPKTKPAKSASTLIRLVAQAEKSLAQANEKQSKLLAELALAKGDHAALAKVSEELAAAQAVVALLSDWFPKTTAEIIHVDGGLHAMGA